MGVFGSKSTLLVFSRNGWNKYMVPDDLAHIHMGYIRKAHGADGNLSRNPCDSVRA